MTSAASDLVLPGQPESTPQKLPRRGPTKLWTRQRVDLYTPEHAATIDAIARGVHPITMAALPVVTPAQTKATLAQHLGFAYGFWDRCGGTHHEHDCSGYICWAANMLGLAFGCVSSFTIAQWCWDAGLDITEEEARATDGTLAFHGPNGGRGPSQARNGADGHVVACYVPSTGGTYEAMGHAYGVVRGSFDGRAWVAYAKWPGVTFDGGATPQLQTTELDMILQTYHFDPVTGKETGRIKPTVDGQDAHWMIAADGTRMEGRYGASIANDHEVKGHPQDLRTFVPIELGTAKIVGAIARVITPEDNRHGLVIRDNLGRTHRAHFS